jgi:hypothetical protein
MANPYAALISFFRRFYPPGVWSCLPQLAELRGRVLWTLGPAGPHDLFPNFGGNKLLAIFAETLKPGGRNPFVTG